MWVKLPVRDFNEDCIKLPFLCKILLWLLKIRLISEASAVLVCVLV